MEWIFNEYFLENQYFLFYISIILFVIMTVTPYLIARKIIIRNKK